MRAVGVGVHLGTAPILRGLDLTLTAGEVVAVTGANGSGKSTLLRLLATLVRPSVGHLELLGVAAPGRVAPATRRAIGYVGHHHALHPDLTVGENLQLVARLVGTNRDAATLALEDVGLTAAADRPVRVCSEGMRRRTELARILLCRPRLLLLDEPHAALDATSRALVDRATAEVTRRGGAAVLVTHDPATVSGIADRVLRLSGGRLMPEDLP